jgi:predicted transposase YdaD
LQEIVRDSESGPMRVDRLVEMRRRDGGKELLLVHVEVQAQRDDDLPRRMFRYFCRIFDRFGQPPISLAVLADPNPRWRPKAFTSSLAGCSLNFQYVTCKLTDLELEPWIAAGNPVARIIEAHRIAQGTGKDVRARRSGKLGLVRRLLESGMGEVEVREVMRLIHWLLALPEEEELGFRKDVKEMEASMQTKRRSTYERIVWEEGLVQGRDEGRMEGRHSAAQELLLELVSERFGPCSEQLKERVGAIRDEARLRQLARVTLTASTLPEFEARIDG